MSDGLLKEGKVEEALDLWQSAKHLKFNVVEYFRTIPQKPFLEGLIKRKLISPQSALESMIVLVKGGKGDDLVELAAQILEKFPASILFPQALWGLFKGEQKEMRLARAVLALKGPLPQKLTAPLSLLCQGAPIETAAALLRFSREKRA